MRSAISVLSGIALLTVQVSLAAKRNSGGSNAGGSCGLNAGFDSGRGD